MAYKILTKNGIENTNIDGARENFFNTGMRDGIVQGVLNEGRFESNASNSIYIDSCELRIGGHRVLIDEPVYKTFSSTPANDTRYSMVAQIVVSDNRDVSFLLFVQAVETVLIKDNLYATTTGQGTYQVEIGRFTLTNTGTIEDVVKTIDTITGATESIACGVNIGNVTTNKIDYTLDAEVDVNQRYDSQQKKTFTDFNFQIPADFTPMDTKVNNALNIANQANTNSQQANETANTANQTANNASNKADTAESNSSTALSNSQTAMTIASNAVDTANTANTKADSAVQTANDALERVVSGQGTNVMVGGVLQSEWNADQKADTDDIPTTLAELTGDTTHRTVTDAEKANWNNKLDNYTETDPTVPEWAKQPNKPTYTASEVGAISNAENETVTGIINFSNGLLSKGYNVVNTTQGEIINSTTTSYYALWKLDLGEHPVSIDGVVSNKRFWLIGGNVTSSSGNKTVYFRMNNATGTDIFSTQCLRLSSTSKATGAADRGWDFGDISSKSQGWIVVTGQGARWWALGY